MVKRLTHTDARGHMRMVDVGAKAATHRVAIARAFVRMGASARAALRAGAAKGDVLAAARLAGIQAAKETSRLIPLCHPLPLTRVEVELRPGPRGVAIETRAETVAPTGVEMEALTAASVAALTLYDMLKAVERGMSIERVELVEKRGGRSGVWRRRASGRAAGR